MSAFVLLVAAAHGLAPVLGGVIGKSRNAVIIGAVIGGVIALATGSPRYALPDLFAVGVGTWLALSRFPKTDTDSGSGAS